MLPEVRMARVLEAIGRYRSGELSCLDAADLWIYGRCSVPTASKSAQASW